MLCCFIARLLTLEKQILLWDHLLTFHDEVRLIWRAQLTIPKVLFLFNRYVVPASLIVLIYGKLLGLCWLAHLTFIS